MERSSSSAGSPMTCCLTRMGSLRRSTALSGAQASGGWPTLALPSCCTTAHAVPPAQPPEVRRTAKDGARYTWA
eukprot:3978169-Alexandrium_andersonii.AAC.1